MRDRMMGRLNVLLLDLEGSRELEDGRRLVLHQLIVPVLDRQLFRKFTLQPLLFLLLLDVLGRLEQSLKIHLVLYEGNKRKNLFMGPRETFLVV